MTNKSYLVHFIDQLVKVTNALIASGYDVTSFEYKHDAVCEDILSPEGFIYAMNLIMRMVPGSIVWSGRLYPIWQHKYTYEYKHIMLLTTTTKNNKNKSFNNPNNDNTTHEKIHHYSMNCNNTNHDEECVCDVECECFHTSIPTREYYYYDSCYDVSSFPVFVLSGTNMFYDTHTQL